MLHPKTISLCLKDLNMQKQNIRTTRKNIENVFMTLGQGITPKHEKRKPQRQIATVLIISKCKLCVRQKKKKNPKHQKQG